MHRPTVWPSLTRPHLMGLLLTTTTLIAWLSPSQIYSYAFTWLPLMCTHSLCVPLLLPLPVVHLSHSHLSVCCFVAHCSIFLSGLFVSVFGMSHCLCDALSFSLLSLFTQFVFYYLHMDIWLPVSFCMILSDTKFFSCRSFHYFSLSKLTLLNPANSLWHHSFSCWHTLFSLFQWFWSVLN